MPLHGECLALLQTARPSAKTTSRPQTHRTPTTHHAPGDAFRQPSSPPATHAECIAPTPPIRRPINHQFPPTAGNTGGCSLEVRINLPYNRTCELLSRRYHTTIRARASRRHAATSPQPETGLHTPIFAKQTHFHHPLRQPSSKAPFGGRCSVAWGVSFRPKMVQRFHPRRARGFRPRGTTGFHPNWSTAPV